MGLRTSKSGRSVAALTASCAALLLAAGPVTAAPADLGERIDPDGVQRHLRALQRIADQNGGNRASGMPGYEASVDYVASELRSAGFDVRTPEFTYQAFYLDHFALGVEGEPVEGRALEYSPATPPGGIDAPLAVAPVDDTPGCEPTDYDGTDIAGSAVLVQRGECEFGQKARVADELGAAGVIVYNDVEGPMNGTLGEPGAAGIPAAGVTKEVGESLAERAGAQVHLDVQSRLEDVTTRNVIAQTRTGRADNVAVAGAHLDSVPEGPGINDNGTGAAGLLETAKTLGPEPDANNAVRFAFWGAEESGLVGSTEYVQGLSFEEQLDIALYLNFDMIGSPNPGFFTYDGDDPDAPHGSARIKQDFVEAMAARDIDVESSAFDGRSDYAGFIDAGIPAGGMHTGVDEIKTEEQAAKWGGTPGVAFDPNYHSAEDDLSNVDHEALESSVRGIARVIEDYAHSTGDVNGTREQRAEQRSAQ